MADFVLSDGREINFDFSKMTWGQWQGIFDAKESEETSDRTIARVSGLEYKDFKKLSYIEARQLMMRFFECAREPLKSPNSQSEST